MVNDTQETLSKIPTDVSLAFCLCLRVQRKVQRLKQLDCVAGKIRSGLSGSKP